ncbi:MAG: cytochrome-c peroxidase [Pedosphaera sp.]|nr:cytochrome-c peroxidase [Pedosphaera sp.]
MKTSTNRFASAIIGFALALASATSPATTAPATNSILSLVRTNASRVSLTISNASDQVWVIQGSSNLTGWTDLDSMKIHNGSYRRTYTNPAGGNLIYRAVYNSARQNIASATTNALLLPGTPFNYAAPALPPSFLVNPIAAQDNMRAANLTTDHGATLGRVLFYDKRLSTNQTLACASCHQQAHGFSDPRQFSVGFDGSVGDRNSMGLSNARWYQRENFFWDERAATLEIQTLMPIQNPIEMGMTLATLTNRLAAEPFYTNLFAKAFGTPAVTSDRISKALAQFVRSIVSTSSKYDLGVTNNFANFTAQENQGRLLFFGAPPGPPGVCAACHGTDNFVPGPAINNNGLEFPFVDRGLGGVTGVPQDDGKFKTPSVRNIELTAPYMHDGRFTNLEQVVEFYNSGVVDNPNLSPPLRTPGGGVLRLNLTAAQKAALVAFLKTLTDTSLATDPKLSDPFNYGD